VVVTEIVPIVTSVVAATIEYVVGPKSWLIVNAAVPVLLNSEGMSSPADEAGCGDKNVVIDSGTLTEIVTLALDELSNELVDAGLPTTPAPPWALSP